jgi:histone-lysine N-methyltransferase SETMAR
MLAEELNLEKETVRKILTEDLGMRKVSAKTVPQILSDDQKQRWLDVCSELSHQLAEGNNFLDRVITSDESWCVQYDPETKCQSMQWKTSVSPRPKKAHVMSPSEDNAHLFFDHKGIVHVEFLEQGQTVNQHCYLEILERLNEAVRWRRPELWLEVWILHHDNAPVHDELTVGSFWPKNR